LKNIPSFHFSPAKETAGPASPPFPSFRPALLPFTARSLPGPSRAAQLHRGPHALGLQRLRPHASLLFSLTARWPHAVRRPRVSRPHASLLPLAAQPAPPEAATVPFPSSPRSFPSSARRWRTPRRQATALARPHGKRLITAPRSPSLYAAAARL